MLILMGVSPKMVMLPTQSDANPLLLRPQLKTTRLSVFVFWMKQSFSGNIAERGKDGAKQLVVKCYVRPPPMGMIHVRCGA